MYRKDSTLYLLMFVFFILFSRIFAMIGDIYYNLVISRGVDKLLTDDSFWSLHRVVGASRQYFTIERKHFAVALHFTHLLHCVVVSCGQTFEFNYILYYSASHTHTSVACFAFLTILNWEGHHNPKSNLTNELFLVEFVTMPSILLTFPLNSKVQTKSRFQTRR